MHLEFLSGERACGSKASESLEPLSSEVKFKLQQHGWWEGIAYLLLITPCGVNFI